MSPQVPPFARGEHKHLEALVATSAARGRALFHLDLAAALASDHVRATFADPAASGIADWIVDVGPNGHEVWFLTRAEPPHMRFRVGFTADGSPLGERVNDTATPRQLIMAGAIRTALAAEMVPNDVAYNPILVPPPPYLVNDTPLEVYLICAAPMPGDVVIGEHWHVLVTSDGEHVLNSRALSHSDLTVPRWSGPPSGNVVITDPLGEAPSEIHVYLSFKYDRPIDVVTVTSNAHWRVQADEITFLGFLDEPAH